MLFTPNSFLQTLHRELQSALYNEKVTYDVLTNLHKKFCSFIHGCDKIIESEQVKLLARCCLQYIECIQNHVSNSPIRDKAHVEALKEFIGVIGDVTNLDGIKEAYLICITVPIFEKVVEPDMKLWLAKELLKNFNLVVQGTRTNIRHAIVENHQLYLCKLADTICTCGDYNYQVLLLEAIFRMSSEAQINQYAHELFPTSVQFENELRRINKDHFDKDVRTFLNMVNSELKNVLSLKCEIAQLGCINIAAPRMVTESEQSELFLWADFNLGPKTITIICDKDSLRTNSVSENIDGEEFEIITINSEDIEDVLMSRIRVPDSPTSIGFVISFKMAAPCSVLYPSSEAATGATQLKLAIYNCPELSELVENVLPHWFGEEFNSLSQSNETSGLKQKTRTKLKKKIEPEAPSSNLANSAPSSQEEPETSNLKQKNAAPLKISFSGRKELKPLETEDASIPSRLASVASSKSSTSDAKSLQDNLHKHQGKSFVRTTEKDCVSKSPKILDVEELKEKASDLQLALLANRQEENRQLTLKEKVVLSIPEQKEESVRDASDDIFVENENHHAKIKPKRRISVAKPKEIIKIKWAWPKRVSISRPIPPSTSEGSELADVASSDKVLSSNIDETSNKTKKLKKKNKDKHKQMQEEAKEYFTKKQTLDSLEDSITPFLPFSENTESVKKGTNSTMKNTNKTRCSIAKQTRKSTQLDQTVKSKKTETPVNTELTQSEQPSTLQVSISEEPYGGSTKNTGEALFNSQQHRLCKLIEDVAKETYGTTNVCIELEQHKPIEQLNENQITENCREDLNSSKQKFEENHEVPVIDLTADESFELEETVDVDVNIESVDHNKDPKSQKGVYSEKEGSSDVMERSNLEETVVQIHQPEQEIVDKICKSTKLVTPARRNQRKTIKKTKIGKAQAKVDEGVDLLTNEPSENTKNACHIEDFKNQYVEKASNDEDGLKTYDTTVAQTLNKEECLNKERESEKDKTSTEEQQLIKANKTQDTSNKNDPLDESVNEEIPSEIKKNQKDISQGSSGGQIDTGAIFDLLLEEYKTSQTNNITNTTIEEPLNKNLSSEELLNEDMPNIESNQNKTRNQNKTDKHQGRANNVTDISNEKASVKKSSKASEKNKNKISKKNREKDEPSETYSKLKEALTKEREKEHTMKDEMQTIGHEGKEVEEQVRSDTYNFQEGSSLEDFVKESKSDKKGKTPKKTPVKKTKDHLHSLDKVMENATCSKKIPNNNNSSKKDKISQKGFKSEMETINDGQKEEPEEQLSKKIIPSWKSKNFVDKTTDEDHSKTRHSVEEMPKEISSQEYFEDVKSSKKAKISQKKRKREIETISKTSQRNALSRKENGKKPKKNSRNTEKKIIENTSDLDLQVAQQHQDEQIERIIVQEENIQTIETTRPKSIAPETIKEQWATPNTPGIKLTPVVVLLRRCLLLPSSLYGAQVQNKNETVEKFQSKTDNVKIIDEDQSLLQSRVEENLTPVVHKVLPLPESFDDEQVQNKEYIPIVEKVKSKTDIVKINEDQVLLQNATEENSAAAVVVDNKNRKVLPLPDSSDEEQVQNEKYVPTVEKVQPKSDNVKINEDQVLLQSTTEENLTPTVVDSKKRKLLPLLDSSDEEQVQNEKYVPTVEKVQPKSDNVKINEDQVLLQSTTEENLTPTVVDNKKRKLLPLPDSTDDEQTQNKRNSTTEKADIARTTEDEHHGTLSSSKKRKLHTLYGTLVKDQHQRKELEENTLPETAQSKIDTIDTIETIRDTTETNEGQLFLQNSESNKKPLSPLPYGSKEEQLQKQDTPMEQQEERVPSIETIEPDKMFDQLLLESNVKENLPAQSKKRKLLQHNSDNKPPEKKTKRRKTDQAEKISKTDGTDLKKVKKIQTKTRKLYNLNDTSYFDTEDESTIRQDLPDELPIGEGQKQKKTLKTLFISIEKLPRRNDPLVRTSVNEDQNLDEIQTKLDKLEKLTIDQDRKDHEANKEKSVIEDQKYQIAPKAPGLSEDTPTKDKSSLLTSTKPQGKQEAEQDQNHNEIQNYFKEPEKPRQTMKTIEHIIQDRNNNKNKNPSKDYHNDFEQPTGDIPVQNEKRLEKVIQKPQNFSSYSSKKWSKREEHEKRNKQRRSWDCERSSRTNPLEFHTYTESHLKSSKRLERKLEFDIFMKSFDITLRQYDGMINDSLRRHNYKSDVSRRKNGERKYSKLNTYDKRPKIPRVKQLKEEKSIAGYYKKLPTQDSQPLSKLPVENEIIKTSAMELSDLDPVEVNTEASSKISSKKTKNHHDGVSLARQDLEKENSSVIVISETIENEARVDLEENYFHVSPLDGPKKPVQSDRNIRTWIDGVTIIKSLRKLDRKVSNIKSVVSNLQMWMVEKHSKKSN